MNNKLSSLTEKKSFPREKLKPGQDSFLLFSKDVSHIRQRMKNEIYYKGKLMHKYVAWRKFLNYLRMMNDPHIEIREAKNEPLKA
jgi:hypothetical protein